MATLGHQTPDEDVLSCDFAMYNVLLVVSALLADVDCLKVLTFILPDICCLQFRFYMLTLRAPIRHADTTRMDKHAIQDSPVEDRSPTPRFNMQGRLAHIQLGTPIMYQIIFETQ